MKDAFRCRGTSGATEPWHEWALNQITTTSRRRHHHDKQRIHHTNPECAFVLLPPTSKAKRETRASKNNSSNDIPRRIRRTPRSYSDLWVAGCRARLAAAGPCLPLSSPHLRPPDAPLLVVAGAAGSSPGRSAFLPCRGPHFQRQVLRFVAGQTTCTHTRMMTGGGGGSQKRHKKVSLGMERFRRSTKSTWLVSILE